MLNSTVRGYKACWRVMAMCLGLLSTPAFSAAPAYSTVFAFDQHYTTAGVVEGTGGNAGMLFGTTQDTSLSYGGSIYKVPMAGGAPQIIYQFKETDGYSPQATLLVGSDGFLYGTTYYGHRQGVITSAGSGTIFRVAQDGSGFTTLHTFADRDNLVSYTNVDGMYPNQALIEAGGYLYGVTSLGGSNGTGTVFRVRMSDGVFEPLYAFSATLQDGTTSSGDGAFPSSPLTLANNGRLYGVTFGGGNQLKTTSAGTAGAGTIYSLNIDGTGFTTEHVFSALNDTTTGINSDGAQPRGRLLLNNGVLIGTASDGGTPSSGTGVGTVFSFDPGSNTFLAQYSFDTTNGATPIGDLVLDNGLVYGVTVTGSASAPVTAYGNLFSIDPANPGASYKIEHSWAFTDGSGPTGGLIKASDGDLYGTVQSGNACTALNGSGYGGVFRYSVNTGASSAGYANCTLPSSSNGGGSMSPGLLWLLAVLGLAPPVRRRWFACN